MIDKRKKRRGKKSPSRAEDQVKYWDSFAEIIMESIESRHAQKISQADLARRMGSKQSVISRFENMGRLPSYDFISRLAMALGHSPGMTLYGEYMAIIPLAKQGLIKDRAEREGISTEALPCAASCISISI